ncbi:MAG: M13 family metallopeptidase, partial [Pseudomonadota bacterium]
MKRALLFSSATALIAACSAATDDAGNLSAANAETPGDAVAFEPRPIVTTSRDDWGSFGLDLVSMNVDVHPGDNFFRHVNGTWLDTFEMPADQSRYGSFSILREKSEQRVRNIIDELAATAPSPDTMEGKIAAIYSAFMDTEGIELAGIAPAQPYLDTIAAITTYEDLARLFGSSGYASPVGGFVEIDPRQPDTYIFQVTQSGLGLPDRDYYLQQTERNEDLLAAYRNYLTILLSEAGYEDVGAVADDIIALETRIAAEHWDRTVGRNRNITNNKLSRDELLSLGAGFPVDEMLQAIGVDDQENFIVRQVTPTPEEIEDYGLTDEQIAKLGNGITGLFRVASETELDTWKAYLTAHFLSDHAAVLPGAIDNASFELYGRTLRGQEEQRERWKRGVGAVENAMGEGVGRVYADRHFPAANKAAMDDLVANLRIAMAANLDDITWMGEETKVEARDKLAKFTPKIGFTADFETFDTLEVGNSALENMVLANEWAFQENIGKLGEPIDKTEWFMFPQTVNAYYSPTRNEIVFPAAILQPPFFNISADPAINYGAIGGVIGHEMGHGFDDQGSKSDGDGRLRDWWTDEDRANFDGLTGNLAAQYNAFCPLDEGQTCVNGRLGLGENIGDLGGLSMAYRAYKISLDADGDGEISDEEQPPMLAGLTGDQRFFMAWAQVWRNMYREEALRQQLIRGPHSPPRYRVNGVVRNLDEWYEAFGVTEEHELYLPPE